MPTEPATISELKEYWKYRKTLKVGSVIENHIETHRMPSWDEICSDLNWDTYVLDNGAFSKRHHGYYGAYRLFGLSEDNNQYQPAVLARACGDDRTGTLYIGKAGWLNERLNQMRRSLNREDTHGAIRLWRDTKPLIEKFGRQRLGVALLFFDVGNEGILEADLMRAYRNSFGDTPPLNCSF